MRERWVGGRAKACGAGSSLAWFGPASRRYSWWSLSTSYSRRHWSIASGPRRNQPKRPVNGRGSVRPAEDNSSLAQVGTRHPHLVTQRPHRRLVLLRRLLHLVCRDLQRVGREQV